MKRVALLIGVIWSMIAGAQQTHQCLGTGHDQGKAVDIGELNSKPVSLYGKDPEVTRMVKQAQDVFNHPKDGKSVPSDNYGPAGLYRNGKSFTDKTLQENHTDHIHIRYD